MSFDGLCLKIYFWPFLSYLASLKGLCPFCPPTTTLPPTVSTAIPTFQPTLPTTLPPCPADPLVCLPNGERPISYCPCIDPRQQNGQSATQDFTTPPISAGRNIQISRLRLAMTFPISTEPTEVMIFSKLDNSKKRRKRRKRQNS